MPEEQRTALLHQIQETRQKVDQDVQRLRSATSRMTYTALSASALSTVVSGMAAALGPSVGEGPTAWKITCAVAALLTAVGGMLSGVNQQVGNADKLARGLLCAGQLRSLEVALTLSGRDPGQVAQEFAELIASNHEFGLGDQSTFKSATTVRNTNLHQKEMTV